MKKIHEEQVNLHGPTVIWNNNNNITQTTNQMKKRLGMDFKLREEKGHWWKTLDV